MIHIAINGFGRIGRTLLRQLLQMPQIKIVAINDLADAQTLAHLFKYDSIHGLFDGTVASQAHAFVINEQEIPLYNEREPQNLPWKQLDVDILIECSGKFTSYDKAILHHHAGARKVIISAPATGNLKSVVIGVNEQILDGSEIVVSNASCTTNNAAPMLKVLNDNWGIESAFITTVHAFTGDQNLHDAPHKDLRRARAATQSIIPTTTGAAKAITDIFPEMKGHIGGAGIRVPVPDGSLTDITCILNRETTVDEIKATFKQAADTYLKNILQYTTDPIVSIDIVGNKHSCIFDAQLTTVVGRMVKVVGWYDNEMGYATRLSELILILAK